MDAMHRARQSFGIVVFAVTLGIAVLLWGLLDPAASQIFDMTANQANSTQAKNVIQTRRAVWNNILLFVLIFAGVVLLARAVYQSRGP